MKAAICTRYGPPETLKIETDVEKPRPAHREVSVKVRASTVSSSDTFVRSGIPTFPLPTRMMMRLLVGITHPRKRILGLVLAGEIEEIGASVTRFEVGDRVYAFTKFNFGAYAQYSCLPQQSTIGLAPSNLSLEQAAAIPYGGLLALHYLRKGKIQERSRVMIYGASGEVGTSAVQLAKHFGASVTAACGPTNLDLVRSLGAEAALDYTSAEVSHADTSYDLVFDAVGKRKTSPLKAAVRKAIAPGGRYISVDDGTPQLPPDNLETLKDLVEAGELRPVIDRFYRLDELAAAHRYVEQAHKKGAVVIKVDHDD